MLGRKLLCVPFLSLFFFGLAHGQISSGLQSEVRVPSDKEFQVQRAQAHQAMISGDPVGAAESLISGLRGLPTDNPKVTDRASGNYQLLLFDINFLMTDAMRKDYFSRVLNPKGSELDSFIVTLHEASQEKSPEQLEAFLQRLWNYSQSSNQLVAPVALGLLANPYYSADTEIGVVASEQMMSRYPELEATRLVLIVPVYERRDKPAIAGEWVRAYLGKPTEAGKARAREVSEAEKSVAVRDDLISKLESPLDQLSQPETKKKGVEQLVALVTDANEKWQDRYTYLRMLEPEMKAPPGGADAQGYWKNIKPAIEELARKEELTPDVFRARVQLCTVAMSGGNFEEASYWAERMLTEQDRLYEYQERILYEEAVKTYQGYAQSLNQYGKPHQAADAYRRLAKYYPNSALAADCERLANETLAKGK